MQKPKSCCELRQVLALLFAEVPGVHTNSDAHEIFTLAKQHFLHLKQQHGIARGLNAMRKFCKNSADNQNLNCLPEEKRRSLFSALDRLLSDYESKNHIREMVRHVLGSVE